MHSKSLTTALTILLVLIIGASWTVLAEEELQDLVDALASPELQARRQAAEQLVAQGNPGVSGLEQALFQPNIAAWTGQEIIRVLRNIGSVEAVEVITNALFLPDATIRLSAARALDRLGHRSQSAVPSLIIAIKDPNVDVRAAAANALGNTGITNEEATLALIIAMGDSHHGVAWAATMAIQRFAREDSQVATTALHMLASDSFQHQQSAARALRQMGDPAIAVLIEALQDDDPMLRGQAATILGRFGTSARDAAPHLVHALTDENEMVRRSVVQAIATVEPAANEAIPLLLHVLVDDRLNSLWTRWAALESLCDLSGISIAQLVNEFEQVSHQLADWITAQSEREDVDSTMETIEALRSSYSEANRALFVSPSGNDNWSGRLPQANEAKTDGPFATLEAARDAIRALRANQTVPEGGVTVYLRQGTYRLESTFQLSQQDSGTPGNPIVYSAYDGEQATITGAVTLQPESFRLVQDATTLQRLHATAHGSVYALHLRELGIVDYGTLRQSGVAEAELFFNDEAMILARYPNQGFLQTGPQVSAGGTGAGTIFAHQGELPHWENAADIWMHGYWWWDWRDVRVQVETIDRQQRTIEAKQTIQQFSQVGTKAGQRYYFYNLLEELNHPGEYYIDRQEGVLYFFPSAPLENAKIQLSMVESPLVSMQDTEHIKLQQLVFEASRGDGIQIKGGSHNVIAGCTIRNLGQRGVTINDGDNNGVLSSTIYQTGAGGIQLHGGDRQTLTKANHFVVNTQIYDYQRRERTYTPAISVRGVGNRIANNAIHDGPHTGLSFSGNDHIIEHNIFHNVGFECNDNGAIYGHSDWTARGTVIRQNFFHHLRGVEGHTIKTPGVYLDDGRSGIDVIGNVFFDVDMAVFVHGGRDNYIADNMIINSEQSIRISDGSGQTWWEDKYVRLLDQLRMVPFDEAPYTKYENLSNILDDDYRYPKHNQALRNVMYNTPDLALAHNARIYGQFADNMVIEAPSPFDFFDAETLTITIPDGAIIYSDVKNFDHIPFDKIGLYSDQYRQ